MDEKIKEALHKAYTGEAKAVFRRNPRGTCPAGTPRDWEHGGEP
jgi:hypothetical protein